MKRISLSLCAIFCVFAAYAQTTEYFSSGTTVVNSSSSNVVTYDAGSFINNGTYTDNAGTVNVIGGITFSGTGTTTFYDLNFNAGSSLMNSLITVKHSISIASGATLNANGNLSLNPGATISVSGILSNPVLGIVASATVTTGGCPSYSSVLSTNISGPVVTYQWQSSPDNITWTSVSGATSGSYTATVTSSVYYRCDIATTNSSFTDTTAGVLLNFSGTPPAAITGTASVCQGALTSLSDASGGGVWSSASTLIATVNSTNGQVTGVAPGTAIISYSTGCAPDATITVTVNQNPGPITGTFSVCTGQTNSLFDGITGGTWSSNNIGIATINGSGLYGGVSSGSTLITYTLTGNCYVTHGVTVNTSPAPITASNVCLGSTASESDATGGGTWSASNGNVTINSTSGSVTGITTGTVTVVYTMPAGCSVSAPVTVNSLPSSITGGASPICAGTTTTLNSTPSGGSWLSSDNTVATVNSSTGVVYGVAAGTSTITYLLATGCYNTKAVTVNLSPTPILGNLNVCASGGTTTLGDATGSGTWSSSAPGTAGIGSATGLVTGGTPGNATITYTLPDGCAISATVTVNSLPASLTGTQTMCAGSGTSFSSTTPGGTWSSSNATIASVDGSGNISGLSAGNATITYTLPTGCYVTRGATVNPVPASITGLFSLCAGATNIYTDAVTGGNWSSSNTSVASVGSTTGLVTAGTVLSTATITYTLPAGCFTTATVTVNAQPAGITGTGSVCATLTTTLNSSPAGGAWTSANTSVATVGTSGVVTGVAGGTATISYSFPTGCMVSTIVTVNALPVVVISVAPNPVCVGTSQTFSTTTPGTYSWNFGDATTSTSNPAPHTYAVFGTYTATLTVTNASGCVASATAAVTVNATPSAISGGTSGFCVGTTTSLSSAPAGGTWSSSNTSLATVGTGGVVTGVAGGNPVITYTSPAGCITTKTITVNALPIIYSATGGGSYCPGGGGVVIGISNSQVGVNYSLVLGGSTVSTLPGSGTSFNFAPQTTAGTYTILATNATTACSVNMSGSSSIVINTPPTVFSMTGGGGYCAGGTGVPVGLSGSQAGVNYQLFNGGPVGSPVAGTGGALSFGLQTAGGTYTVVATSVATGCTSNMTGAAVVTVSPLPFVFSVSGGGSYCSGGAGVTINLSGSQGGVSYQLYNGASPAGSPVAGTGTGISFTGVTTGGTLSVLATNTTSGCTSLMFGSATITVLPLPTLHNVIGGGAYCAGGTGVHIFLDYSDVGINYQLYYGAAPVGLSVAGTNSGLDMGLVTSVGTYTVSATNPTTSCSIGMTGSASVSTNPLPTAYSMTGGGGYCVGGTGVTVGLSNSQPGVNYQLYNGPTLMGAPVAGTGGSISFGLQTSAGTYSVTGTYTSTGCNNNMSTTVVVTVNPLPTAITGTALVCPTTTTTLNSTPAGGTWTSSNGSLATVGSLTGVVTGVAAGNPIITYTLGTGCLTTVTITVNSTPSPIAGGTSVCMGSTLTLSDPLGGGTWASGTLSVATIGSSSGTVSPVGPGTTLIKYTAATGCTTSQIVSVNSLPGTISGGPVCTGSTTPMSSSPGSGTWSSGNLLIATVNSVTGLAGGVAAGTVNMTYTLGTGCISVGVLTVNMTPAGITGPAAVCSLSTITLSDGTSGGTWTSSSTTIASVGSTTGIVTGGTSGTTNINYVMPTGCSVSYPITVNANPGSITGPGSVCTGFPISLVSSPAGGVWSSSNTALATVGTSGTVNGVAVGVPTITYMLATGCKATTPITVNQTPAAITGTPVVCTGSNITLSDATSGGVWSSISPSVATVGAFSGTVGGVAFGTSVVNYTMSTGCLASVTVTVNSTPGAISPSSPAVCTGFTLPLSSSPGGGTWTSSNTSVASVNSGGGVIGLTTGTATITYTVSSGCFVTATVTVNQTPAAISGALTVCAGSVTVLSDATSGGTWSSTNTSQAIISPSGVVVGLSGGNPVISYTMSTGCAATATLTVNASPVSISATGGLTGIITTLAGNGSAGYTGDGGAATSAQVGLPIAVAVDGSGNIYIADFNNNVIRKVNSAGVITTFAGNGTPGFSGDGGPATAATLNNVWDVAVDGSGNVYIADEGNQRIRKVNSAGTISTVAGNGGIGYAGDGIAATSTSLWAPTGVTVDGAGNVYIAEIFGNRVRKVNTAGIISTYAGNGSAGFSGDGGLATTAQLNGDYRVTADAAGNIYIADQGNNRIRKVNISGVIFTAAGNGIPGFGGDGGPATSANLSSDYGVCTDWAGNLYIADYGNARVRKVNNAGVISTIAGTGSYSYSGDGGLATSAGIAPPGVAADAFGNVFIADYGNSRIRKVYGPTVCAGSALTLTESSPGGAWSSSNTSIATVGSTGIVTGVANGLATIAYTMPSGCSATLPVSVNPLPAAISGNTSLCLGLTGTLSDGVSGGTWSSSNTSVATVGSLTGVVSAVGLGNSFISYTLPTGCAQSVQVTVNVQPAPITGPSTVCVNSIANLIETTGGGSWTSGNTALATVNGSGAVYGVFPGTVTILYTMPSGCSVSWLMTVNPTPAAIGGPTGVCIGSTITLTDASFGGTWSSSATSLATVDASTGVVMGVAAGIPTITYTLPTGCKATKAVTVNALPTVFTITGGGAYCTGGTGIDLGLSGSNTGISYQLWNGGTAGTTVAGTGSAIDFGYQTGGGTYKAVATNTTTGCSDTMSSTATIVVNTLPAAFFVTGGGSYCAGTGGAPFGLSSSAPGISYQLMIGGSTPSGSPVAGTGSAISFGPRTTAGTYSVVATNTTTGCTAVMTGSIPLTISPLPTAYTVSGGGGYCAGSAGATINLGGSDVGTVYALNFGVTTVSTMSGTGTPLVFGPVTGVGTYAIVATSLSTSCSATMPGTIAVSVNPVPTPYTIGGGGAYCSGGTGVNVTLSGSNTGISYQIMVGGSAIGAPMAGTGSSLNFGPQTVAGTYTIVATNTTTLCTNTMTGSVTVSINPLPLAFTVSPGGGYCSGGGGVIISLSGTESLVSYQLFRGGTSVGAAIIGGGGPITFPAQTIGGTYTIVGTNGPGCNTTMIGSAIVTVFPLPTAYTVTGGGSYCSGGTGAHIGLSNSDPGISYQLMFGGSAIGAAVTGTGSAIDFGLFTGTGSSYTVVATNIASLCTNNMTGSVTVTPATLPTAFNVTGGGSYCAGGPGMIVGLNGSTTLVNYQLYNGGLAVGSPVPGTGGTISFGLQVVPGVYTVVATSTTVTGVGTFCSNSMIGNAIITVNSLPVAYPVLGGGTICAGAPGMLVSLASSDLGINYQLYRGATLVGSPVPGTGSAISFGTQTVAGIYKVIATNPATLCTNTMSGTANIVVNPLPALHSVTGGGSYCSGGAGVHIGLDGSDAGISYQLYSGIIAVGPTVSGTGTALDFGTMSVPGTYTVTGVNATTGCTTAMSAGATVSVNALPAAYTITGGGSYCAGGSGVVVGMSNTDLGISYQLYNGTSPSGAAVAGSGSSISFGLRTAPGVYTVVATNTVTTCTSNMAGTVTISVNPLPTAYAVGGGGSYCSGGTGVHITLGGSTAGVSYQLYNGTLPVGSSVSGTGSMLDFGLQTGAGNYTVLATDGITSCSSAMLGSANISINPLPNTFSLLGGGAYCAGLSGVDVSLSGSELGVRYQLYNGLSTVGSSMTGTGLAIDFGMQAAAGSYTVVASNATTACTVNMTGSASVSINPLPLAFTVTGGGIYCDGGSGVNVGLSGSAAGINYQLFRGVSPVGSNVPGTGASLSFGMQNVIGSYSVIATDAATSCTSSMTGMVTVSVNPLPAVYHVTGGGNYCTGGAGMSVALNGSAMGINYQLYLNGVASGSPVAGTGATLNFGLHTAAGNYTVVATNSITGCTSNMADTASIGINPLPNAYAVTGSGSYCAGGTGLNVGLTTSDAGISYQLYHGLSAMGSPVSGTGSSLNFGPQTLAGIYTVVATSATTGCTMQMSDSAMITVNALPTAYAVSGGGSYCAGGVGSLVSISGSAIGISYQVYNGSTPVGMAIAGTGYPLDLGFETIAGTYTVMGTNTVTGCQAMMTGSASVSVNPLPTAYAVTGGGSYCAGGSGNHVMLIGSNSGINYQLYNGSSLVGSPVAGSGGTIDFGAFTAAGTYYVVATNASTGCVAMMNDSASISVNPLPAVFYVTGGGSFCAGGTGVSVSLSNSATGINYQLYNGGTAVGGSVAGSGSVLNFGLQTSPGVYTVVATNATTGCTSNMSASATVAVNALPGVYAVIGGGAYCAGGVGMHIGLSNSDTGVQYQLYIGGSTPSGSPVSGTGAGIDFGLKTTGGSYTVVATNATTGCFINMSGSASIAVNALPTPYLLTGGGNYCASGSGVAVGLSTSDNGISYQLYHDGAAIGSAVGGTGSSITFGLQTSAGTYTVIATNMSTSCTNNMADSTSVGIIPTVVPAVTINTGGDDTVCHGSSTTFTALAANGGTSPSFQWFVNGVGTGTSGSYTYIPSNHDTVSVIMTSSAVCPLPATATGSIVMTVLDSLMPSVHISVSPRDTVCAGSDVVFSYSSANGGSSPSYTWILNGATAGTGTTLTFVASNGDVVLCNMNSNYRCRVANSAVSNTIGMTVESPALPVVTITSNPGATSHGMIYNDTLNAAVTNAGFAPRYLWSVNGVDVPYINGPRLILDSVSNNDVISCTVTNMSACGTLVGSGTTTVTVNSTGVTTITNIGGDVKLVPNPNRGIFMLKGSLAATSDEEVTIDVTDMLGQVIYHGTFTARAGQINERIELSKSLANGMYILSMNSSDGSKVFHMVIEQ